MHCGLQMDHLTGRNSSLLKHVSEVEGANAAVQSQLQEFHQKLRLTQVDNGLLQQQIAFLQKQQKVSIMVSFESSHWLDKQVYELPFCLAS